MSRKKTEFQNIGGVILWCWDKCHGDRVDGGMAMRRKETTAATNPARGHLLIMVMAIVDDATNEGE